MTGVAVIHIGIVMPFLIDQVKQLFTFLIEFPRVEPACHRISGTFSINGSFNLQVALHAPAHASETTVYNLYNFHLADVAVTRFATLVTTATEKHQTAFQTSRVVL